MVIGTLLVPSEVDAEDSLEAGEVVGPELDSVLEEVVEAGVGVDEGVVSVELSELLDGVVVGPELEEVAVIV